MEDNKKETFEITKENPAVPYTATREPINYKEIEDNNPLKSYIHKRYLEQELDIFYVNKLNDMAKAKKLDIGDITEEDFEEALKHLVPKEFKKGDSFMLARDESISYEDFEATAKKLENVSKSDVSFAEMPRIFILAELPPETTKTGFILRNMQNAMDSSFANYYPVIDTVLFSEEYLKKHTKDENEATFGHEYGHRLIDHSEGVISAKYDLKKHVAIIGEDLSKCDPYSTAGDPVKCKELTSKLTTDFVNNQRHIVELAKMAIDRAEEIKADRYAALAGYATPLTTVVMKQYLGHSPKNTHPATDERVALIKAVEENPAAARAELKKELEALKGYRSAYANSDDYELKNPLSTGAVPTSEQHR